MAKIEPRLRICVLSSHNPLGTSAGGGSRVVRRLALYLSKKNDVRIIASSESQKRIETEIEGIPLLLLPYPPTSIRIRLAALRESWVRESDLVIESADVGGPWFAFSARRRLLLAHQLWQDIFSEELRAPFGAVVKWVEPAFYLPYRGIPTWVNSRSTEESLRAIGVTRIAHLPFGLLMGLGLGSSVEPNAIAPLSSSELLRHPRISIVSRLRKYKGVQFVINELPDILGTYPDVELCIIGRGPYQNELEAKCRRLGVAESVNFVGYLTEAQRDDVLRRSITAIAPSIREGLGLNILEAFRCGTTCVGWNVPGTRDAITDGVNGLLVEFGSSHGLSKAVLDLLSHPEKRDSLANSAFLQFRSFSLPESIEEVDRFISK